MFQDKFIQAIEADKERIKKFPEQNVSVKIVQRQGMEVLTLRKGTNHVVRNKSDSETKTKEDTVPKTDSNLKPKEDMVKKSDVKFNKADKGASPRTKLADAQAKQTTSNDNKVSDKLEKEYMALVSNKQTDNNNPCNERRAPRTHFCLFYLFCRFCV